MKQYQWSKDCFAELKRRFETEIAKETRGGYTIPLRQEFGTAAEFVDNTETGERLYFAFRWCESDPGFPIMLVIQDSKGELVHMMPRDESHVLTDFGTINVPGQYQGTSGDNWREHFDADFEFWFNAVKPYVLAVMGA